MRFWGEWGGSSVVYCYVVYCYNISGQTLSQLKLSPHPLLLRPHLLLLTNNLDFLWKHREPQGVPLDPVQGQLETQGACSGLSLDPHGDRDVSSRRSCGSSVTMAVRDEDSGTSQRSTRNHGPSASSVTACAPSLSCYPPLACGCDASETPSSRAKAPTPSLDARDALIDNALDERGEARLTCQPSAVSTLSPPTSPSSPPPAVSSVYGYGYDYGYGYGYGRAPSERAAAVSAPASSAPCALPAHSTCDITIITSSRSSAMVLDPSRGHGMQGLTASSALLYLSPRASTVGLPHACTWCLAASYPAARQHSA